LGKKRRLNSRDYKQVHLRSERILEKPGVARSKSNGEVEGPIIRPTHKSGGGAGCADQGLEKSGKDGTAYFWKENAYHHFGLGKGDR